MDAMLRTEPGPLGERVLDLVLRYVRVDRVGGHALAGGVHDGDLDAGAEARVESHGGTAAGRGGEEQVAQVPGEHPYRLVLGRLPESEPQVRAEMDQDP